MSYSYPGYFCYSQNIFDLTIYADLGRCEAEIFLSKYILPILDLNLEFERLVFAEEDAGPHFIAQRKAKSATCKFFNSATKSWPLCAMQILMIKIAYQLIRKRKDLK